MSEARTTICATCGRSFAWQKAWERNWERVRYCSAACRSHRVEFVQEGPVVDSSSLRGAVRIRLRS